MKDFFTEADCDVLDVSKGHGYINNQKHGSYAISLDKANRLLRDKMHILQVNGLSFEQIDKLDHYYQIHKGIDIRQEQDSKERRLLSEAAGYLSRNYPLMNHPDDEKYRAKIASEINALLAKDKK